MQYHHIGYRITGFYRLYHYAVKYGMKDKTILHRKQVLEFWDKHGLAATLDAFKHSRRTLYNWKQAVNECGEAGLKPRTKAPEKKRYRQWDKRIVTRIKYLRDLHANLGKDKLAPLLQQYCEQIGLICPSVSTIGRLVADAPDKMRKSPQRLSPTGKLKRYNRQRVQRKPKGFKSTYPGQCVSMDTIERRMGSLKRYVMTFIDPNTSFAFAAAVPGNTSVYASNFFTSAHRCYPFPIEKVLSDNGSEFKGEFDKRLEHAEIEHWHTYPKTPKMNAHCERFNRTIQEDFIDYHEDLLFTDITAFNEKLAEWLVWYNQDRPHYAQGQISPVQAMIKYQPKCNMYWTHTLG